MRTSILNFFLLTTALVSVAPSLGCQPRVVFLSFDAEKLGSDVDRLWIQGIEPAKTRKELSGLQVVGYYDIAPSIQKITVRVTACWGGNLLADQQGEYDIMGNDVTIELTPFIDPGLSPPPLCKMGLGRLDAGGDTSGNGIGDAGGTAGRTDGSAGGGAGGNGSGGAGGTGAGGSGAGGTSDTDGGTTDAAECGTDTHGPVCEPPSGDAGTGDIPEPPAITAECDQYCTSMQNNCSGVSGLYDSPESCRRYCVEAGWANIDPQNRNNSLSCRTSSLAGVTSFNQATNCAIAGPTGNFNCGMPCPNFCAAWAAICHPIAADASGCLTACQALNTSSGGADPSCRFQLLQRALFDTRYCDFVSYTSTSCLRCD